MGGRANPLVQFCRQCFDWLGQPFPFNTCEDVEVARASLDEADSVENVHDTVVFPDATEHRLRMGRFLMGNDYDAVPRQAIVEGFDPYSQAGTIAIQIEHKHFIVRRCGLGKE